MTATAKDLLPARTVRPTSPVASEPNRSPLRDVGVELANAMAGVTYADLPRSAVEAAKRSLIDTIAVVLGASGLADEIDHVADVVTECGGRPEATILGYGRRVPAPMAALVNGAMVHCLDYDDCYQELALHPSAPTVPAGLASAERTGGTTGKVLITAIAVANDFAWRLGSSFDWKMDWFSTPLIGYFTATAAAGKILGLDGAQLFDALGIAFGQAGGTVEMRLSSSAELDGGSAIGGMMSGWPAQAGVLSALLAHRGVHGIPGVFEGQRGFFNMFTGGMYRREELVDEVGSTFRCDEVSFRPWPTCGSSHPSIDATLHLVRDNDLSADDIESVEVRIGHGVDWMLCEPLDKRRAPRTSMDARFSIPFHIATAAIRRAVTLVDFTDRLTDPKVLDLAARVTPVWDPAMQGFTPGIAGSHQVTMRLRSGEVHTYRTDVPYGRHPKDISQSDLEAKFIDCASFAAKPFSREQAARAVGILRDLENHDVAELTAALTVG
jgi:2-methylcitrate dehydratase PrpD